MTETNTGWLMSTKEYSKYFYDLTGKRRSPESIAYSCRNGELDCIMEDGKWCIKVKSTVVPYSLYKEVKKELDETKVILASIKTLLRSFT